VINPETGAIKVPNAEPGVDVNKAIEIGQAARNAHNTKGLVVDRNGDLADARTGKTYDPAQLEAMRTQGNREATLDHVRANAQQHAHAPAHAPQHPNHPAGAWTR